MNLVEGLHEGDLEDIVLPLISVDEFETKLDDDAIVVAFFVKDREPAKDLNRFIQKGSVELLDTDVSPAPNEDGYYLVFVELERNEMFAERLIYILEALRGLTGITTWSGNFFGQEDIHEISEETLDDLVRQVSEDEADEGENIAESLTEFFKESELEDMGVQGRILYLEGITEALHFEIIDFGSFEELKEHNPVMDQGIRLDEQAQANVRDLRRILGEHWVVEHLREHVLLSHAWASDKSLLLRVQYPNSKPIAPTNLFISQA